MAAKINSWSSKQSWKRVFIDEIVTLMRDLQCLIVLSSSSISSFWIRMVSVGKRYPIETFLIRLKDIQSFWHRFHYLHVFTHQFFFGLTKILNTIDFKKSIKLGTLLVDEMFASFHGIVVRIPTGLIIYDKQFAEALADIIRDIGASILFGPYCLEFLICCFEKILQRRFHVVINIAFADKVQRLTCTASMWSQDVDVLRCETFI